jgi:hypothetical protein
MRRSWFEVVPKPFYGERRRFSNFEHWLSLLCCNKKLSIEFYGKKGEFAG